MRFEHIAVNVADARKVTEWYVTHMRLVVMRQSNEPPYVTFLADQGRNMMFEFYEQAHPVADFKSMNAFSFHIAFAVNDIVAERDRLAAAGGTLDGDIATTPAGDKLCFMRDPWGMTLQLVMRSKPML